MKHQIADRAKLFQGDCVEVMATLEADSIDSVVTDPPYGIYFMNKEWDKFGSAIGHDHKKGRERSGSMHAGEYDTSLNGNRGFQEWSTKWAQQAFRIMKPGAWLLCFASPRTYHRMASGVEDAGFEIRDQIMWLFGQGFPKSRNLENEMEGWGTALKPGHEPVVLARKPFRKSIFENVKEHGTGALNIDACRLEGRERTEYGLSSSIRSQGVAYGQPSSAADFDGSKGRWPANVLHDGSDEILEAFAEYGERQSSRVEKPSDCATGGTTSFDAMRGNRPARGYDDEGTAARFFFCAKASKFDREEGLEGFDSKALAYGNQAQAEVKRGNVRHHGESGMNTVKMRKNNHPTVKPTELMRYLCRLITPARGVILDPFMGSGTTGKAALLEEFRFIGIELAEDHVEVSRARIQHAYDQRNDIPALMKRESAEIGQMTIFDMLEKKA